MNNPSMKEEISFKDDGYRITAYRDGKEIGVVVEYKHSECGHLFPQFLKQTIDRTIESCKGAVPEEEPEKRGHYGENDHMHIQHNIGFNACRNQTLTNLEKLK